MSPTDSPEAKAKHALEKLAKAEQQRSDGARAWADYQAVKDAQNANMMRLRGLRLAKEAADKAASLAAGKDAGRQDDDGSPQGRRRKRVSKQKAYKQKA